MMHTMSFLLLVALFLFGTVIASFIGVLTARLHTGQSFLTGRSRCDACDAPLHLFSLMPVCSFLITKGRANCCGARLSSLAPGTELLLGGLFALAYVQLGLTLALFAMFLSLALLLSLVLYDLLHQILPSSLLTIFVLSSAITGYLLTPSLEAFVSSSGTALLIAGSLALVHFFSRGRAMGFADAPFSFGLSLLVGSAAFPGFIFSFWIGAVIGIVILFMRPKSSRMGSEVPFAPFLAAGFLLAYFTQWNPFIFVAASLW